MSRAAAQPIAPATPDGAAATRRLLLLARAALLLMALVVMASAWLRLAAPRPDCVDWPGCRSAMRPALGSAAAGVVLADARVLTVVRGTHRVAASLLLPVVLALAMLARRRGPLGAQALGMCALALALAALGAVTAGARSPWVLLGNLLGGFALLALAWTALCGLRQRSADRTAATWTAQRWALACALLWAVQAAAGALSGAPPGVRPGSTAALAHLLLLAPALLGAGALGFGAARRGRRTEGCALLAVVVAQALLGALAAAWGAPPAFVLGHNALAAAGVALLTGLARPVALRAR